MAALASATCATEASLKTCNHTISSRETRVSRLLKIPPRYSEPAPVHDPAAGDALGRCLTNGLPDLTAPATDCRQRICSALLWVSDDYILDTAWYSAYETV